MASSTLPDQTTNTAAPKPTYFTRFNIRQRIEHLALLVSFTTLAVTGLPQKFADAPISQTILGLLGGIEATRGIHHFAAMVLMALSIYHLLAVIYRVFVKRSALSMFPVVSDFKHLIQDILFYLGKRKHRAYYGRYSYAEKVEYLAVVWGTLVMIITGFMMWNPIATTSLLPGEVIPAAKVAHGGEALLAVLAIILWHFYHVHIRHFNKSMFTGKLMREEMEHEHPAELAMLEAGQESKAPSPAALQRRQRIFYPIAAVLAVAFSFGLFKFVTFEQTSILTMPPGETARVFAPQTPTPSPTRKPTSTPTPGAAIATPAPGGTSTVAWTGGIDQIIAAKCSACHVNAALGGLSMKTYADALKGGKDGAVIVPGDPDKSLLIQIQSKGGHPGQLSADELATVTAWIKAGAPETAGGPQVGPTPNVPRLPIAWPSDIGAIITAECSTCHIDEAQGGLALGTYSSALLGGQSGPALVPGDPVNSLLIQIQSRGGHPGQLSTDEIGQMVEWIRTAAPLMSAATSPVPWPDNIGQIFAARCGACHIDAAQGGLSLKTYTDALKGGKDGPVLIPGDPVQSLLIQLQSRGGHPGQLSVDEIGQIVVWIRSIRPETSGRSSAVSQIAIPSSALVWTGGIDQIIGAKCSACHINTATDGLSMKTYADALKGGVDGPVIVPGDPDKSLLVQVQSKGGHPGQLSADELAQIIAWIKAGAPEK